MVKCSPLKCTFLRFSSAWVKIHQSPHVNFELTSKFLFQLCIFFIVMTNKFPVNFKLIYFLLWMKESHQSPNFKKFRCSGENFPNSSCYFLNRKLVFLQILHHSLVSWKITSLYFLGQTLLQKNNPSANFWDFWMLGSKFTKFM